MFDKIVLIKSCLIVALKFGDGGVQPDGISQIQIVADLLKPPKDLVCPGVLRIIAYYRIQWITKAAIFLKALPIPGDVSAFL